MSQDLSFKKKSYRFLTTLHFHTPGVLPECAAGVCFHPLLILNTFYGAGVPSLYTISSEV